jgi:hypothetical protein
LWCPEVYKLKVKLKPLTIPINEERERIYEQLKRQLEELQLIANSIEIPLKLRLRAAMLVIRACQALDNILTNVQLEEIEEKIHKLQADVEEEKKKRAY